MIVFAYENYSVCGYWPYIHLSISLYIVIFAIDAFHAHHTIEIRCVFDKFRTILYIIIIIYVAYCSKYAEFHIWVNDVDVDDDNDESAQARQ